MCGRYAGPDEAAIERVWHIGRCCRTSFTRRFNVAPTVMQSGLESLHCYPVSARVNDARPDDARLTEPAAVGL